MAQRQLETENFRAPAHVEDNDDEEIMFGLCLSKTIHIYNYSIELFWPKIMNTKLGWRQICHITSIFNGRVYSPLQYFVLCNFIRVTCLNQIKIVRIHKKSNIEHHISFKVMFFSIVIYNMLCFLRYLNRFTIDVEIQYWWLTDYGLIQNLNYFIKYFFVFYLEILFMVAFIRAIQHALATPRNNIKILAKFTDLSTL
ncbi:hypothetical protein ACJX0J_034690 [Zea mays]